MLVKKQFHLLLGHMKKSTQVYLLPSKANKSVCTIYLQKAFVVKSVVFQEIASDEITGNITMKAFWGSSWEMINLKEGELLKTEPYSLPCRNAGQLGAKITGAIL